MRVQAHVLQKTRATQANTAAMRPHVHTRTTPELLLLLLLLLLVTLLDVEVAELVHVGLRGDHAQPVTDLVLLEELLREVLEVLLREAGSRLHNHSGAAPVHLHDLAECASTPVHLDALAQELLLQLVHIGVYSSQKQRWEMEGLEGKTNKGNHVEDLIFGGRSAINGAHHLGNGLHGLLQNHAHNEQETTCKSSICLCAASLTVTNLRHFWRFFLFFSVLH